MSTPELFPAVASDSPRLAWLKRHGVRLVRCAVEDEAELDECCGMGHRWILEDIGPCALPGDTAATGQTADEACANYATAHGLKLWNEESTT